MIDDLFFKTGPALSVIFQLGFEPKPEYFYELTAEQYGHIKAQGRDINKRWFIILSEENKQASDEVMIVNEQEKESLLNAAIVIENYCAESNRDFDNYSDKLEYVASLLPRVFTKNSKYGKNHLKKTK